MRNGVRRFWIIIGGIAAAATVLYGGLLVASLIAHGQHTRTDRFEATGVTTLAVDIGNGRVHVVGSDDDVVSVRARISEGLFPMEYEPARVGDRVDVRSNCPLFINVWCSVDLEISVPESLSEEVRTNKGRQSAEGHDGPATFSTDNGDVSLIELGGTVKVDTDNGDIRMDRLSGAVQVRTDNGTVTTTGTTSDRFDSQSDNGDMELEFASSPRQLTVTTSNGEVDVRLPDEDVAYALDVSTDNGTVRTPIRTDPRSERSLRARSSNGDITVHYLPGR
jgi:hypothetical protein